MSAHEFAVLEMRITPAESELEWITLEIESLAVIDCPPTVPLTVAEVLPLPPPQAPHSVSTAKIALRMWNPPLGIPVPGLPSAVNTEPLRDPPSRNSFPFVAVVEVRLRPLPSLGTFRAS